jgi:HSP20 family protein
MAIELWRRPRGVARPADVWGRDFDDLFGRSFDWPLGRSGGEVRGWSPAVDMIDRPDEIVLRADLPGLEQKDLTAHVQNGVLTITGERREETERKDSDYYCCERWSGTFARSVTLPPGVDAEKINASFRNGVLEIHIPKSKEATGKRIDIKAA